MPFLQPPLRHIFGFKGLMVSSQVVLAGVYKPTSDLNPHIHDLLQELHFPPGILDMGRPSISLTTDSYRSFWKKANQYTSCYPGALSFASLKAGVTDDVIADFE